MTIDNNSIDGKIAIIGMAVRFPGASSLEMFWENLLSSRESISFFSREQLHTSIDRNIIEDPAYVPARGVCDNVDRFDAAFFKMSPLEAAILDPQQRIFLETAHHALEHANQVPERFEGLIGVYGGAGNNMYYLDNIYPNANVHRDYGSFPAMIANEKDFLATRTSYKLNLTGPSISLYTACSTSLVAVCQASDALLGYQCDMALAGGVSVFLPQNSGYLYQPNMIFSRDGHCRAFDKDANGTVFGNGAGVVILKRLADAIAAKDTIHAVLTGTALNNDGGNKMSFMAPSVDGQASVIANAQAVAGISPDEISFIEAHGTATAIGDVIEVAALKEVFKGCNSECLLGTVKSNIGHLDTAAGIAGLIKTVLAIENRVLPPTLHFNEPNPELHLDSTGFRINTKNHFFDKSTFLHAGVSSFGIGGTNAHVIVEQAPVDSEVRRIKSIPVLFCFSAKAEPALLSIKKSLNEWATTPPADDIVNAAWSLFFGRSHYNLRFACVAESKQVLQESVATECKLTSTMLPIHPSKQSVVFLFSGQGSPYFGMAHSLVNTSLPVPVFSVFKQTFDTVATYLSETHNIDLYKELYGNPDRFNTPITDTALAQPALFTVSYALSKALETAGVVPHACAGHSIGEISAAVYCGAIEINEAIDFIVARAAAMQRQPQGVMLSVHAPYFDVAQLLIPGCSISLRNAPGLSVVSGNEESIASFEETLRQQKIPFSRLRTSHAFHSDYIAGAQDAVRMAAKHLTLKPLSIPLLSNVTGTWHSNTTIQDQEYWVRHMIQPVNFSDNMNVLKELPEPIFIEIGPGNILCSLTKENGVASNRCISSMRHAQDGATDETVLLGAIGAAWCRGIDVEGGAIFSNEPVTKIALPGYPFQRKRFWLEADSTLDGISREVETYQDESSTNIDNNEQDSLSEQLEACVKTIPAIADCSVQRVVERETVNVFLFYVLHSGQQITLTELRKHLRENLPGITMPRTISELASIPRSAEGVIDRSRLPLPQSKENKQNDREQPQTVAQRYLAQLWKGVLNRETIFLSDVFFEIGGDSLNCMKVIATINREKGLQLNYGVFIRNDLRQIAQLYNNQLSAVSPQEDKKNGGLFGKFLKNKK